MDRRKFINNSALAVSAAGIGIVPAGEKIIQAKKEFYEWRIYELHFGSNQSLLDNYFEQALIPAMNRQNVKNVGVFRETGKTEPPKIYVLIPYPSMADFELINEKIKADNEFIKASAEYNALPAEKAVFTRYSSSFFLAFDKFPSLVIPKLESRIFEWRNYEGYNENAVERKIEMFNKEEIDIFYKSKLSPVYFGHMISGPNMPSLAYMVVFKDMAERDANWAIFGADVDWKRISQAPKYANSVSKINRIFLEPLPYSQV